MKKVKVILDFIRFAIGEKIEFYRNVITLMTGNTAFSKPDVELVALTALVDKLETDYMASRSGSHELIAKMNQSQEAADEAFRKQAQYVNRIADGDPAVILGAGFHVSKERQPYLRKEFNAIFGVNPGEIILIRKAINGAKSYAWQSCTGALPNNDQSWTFVGFSTQARYVIKGLASGTKYWFRVAAITSNGLGPWSDPIMKVVL
jgi:hypothetical protein